MSAEIDWNKTAEANAGTKLRWLDVKRGNYLVVIVDANGNERAPCAAHDAPEILRVLNDDDDDEPTGETP